LDRGVKAEKNSSPALTILFVAAVAALASIFSWFSSVDTAYYDFLLQKNLLEYPDDVVVIAVDETSIERLGAWPWDRRYHAHLLEKLELADAVVFDFIFAESQSSVLSVSESVDNNIEDAVS
jgi:CHASE2 domain-containing sensor protein